MSAARGDRVALLDAIEGVVGYQPRLVSEIADAVVGHSVRRLPWTFGGWTGRWWLGADGVWRRRFQTVDGRRDFHTGPSVPPRSRRRRKAQS